MVKIRNDQTPKISEQTIGNKKVQSPKVARNLDAKTDSFTAGAVDELKTAIAKAPPVDEKLVSRLKHEISNKNYKIDPNALARIIVEKSIEEELG